MTEAIASGAAPARLHCLGGEVAPEEILRDWRRFAALPDKPLQSLWEILGPSLGKPPDAEMERRAEAFGRLYDLPPGDLQASLRICRFLLSRAASVNLPAGKLAEDLAVLASGGEKAAAVVLAGYDAARSTVRRAILEESILDHGKVMVGLDWRVDSVTGSQRGLDFDAPVALLTLRLREAGREEKTTIYLVPEALAQIKEACASIERVIAARKGGKAGAS